MYHLTSKLSSLLRACGLLLLAGVFFVALPAAAQAIKVTSAVPDTTEQGATGVVVTIGGENFASGAKVNFYVTGTTNPGGIAVKSVRFKDSKTLEATIDVAPDAQTSLKFDVQVRCSGRTGKGTELFSVKTPVLPTCTGCTVVYDLEGNYNREDLMLMYEDGSSKTLLLAGGQLVHHTEPNWSPDGQWIAFQSNMNNENALYVIRNDGSSLTKVAATCNSSWRVRRTGLSWYGPDGNGVNWLLYADDRAADGTCTPGYSNLWVVDVPLGNLGATGTPVALTNTTVSYWWAPSWSYDGKHVAVRFGGVDFSQILILDVAFGPTGPYLVSPADAWDVTPTGMEGQVRDPRWARSRDSLVAVVASGLWRCDVDFTAGTYTWTDLTAGSGYSFLSPSWSWDDSQYVSYASSLSKKGDRGIYVVTPAPLSMRLIATGNFGVCTPDWRP